MSESLTSPLDSPFGLFGGRDFRITTGRCTDCDAIPQALWYFEDETIAAPRPGLPLAGFTPGVRLSEDIERWAGSGAAAGPLAMPSFVWVGSPEMLRSARLSSDGSFLEAGGRRWTFALVPRIALNRSYYDHHSTAFLATRPLTLRGRVDGDRFIARTIWPEDFRLDAGAALRRVEPSAQALRALVREQPRGGAQSPFETVTLWERAPGAARRCEGAPVLAAMLNGAQGDDDEAHGGHFALVTGRVGRGGSIDDWLVNNFYSLDIESEKGIIASMLPLDNYLADLNSGQAWYRPSYLLVAVLREGRAARTIQGALERTYNQFYRHQLVYRHAAMNCASISVDVLRALGWHVPALGATSWLAASLGLPYFLLRERSVAQAALRVDILTEDRTRLLPARAFEQIGVDVLRMSASRLPRTPSPFEAQLAQDLEAVFFLRVPQLPSSRAWGDYPVASPWEYSARLPADPAQRQIVPVPARPFPMRLRDPDLLPAPQPHSGYTIAAWAVLGLAIVAGILWRLAQGG
ncbi:MAG TPA: hypothetical protein VF420_07860 [Casimicrobiaceae bacterium]